MKYQSEVKQLFDVSSAGKDSWIKEGMVCLPNELEYRIIGTMVRQRRSNGKPAVNQW